MEKKRKSKKPVLRKGLTVKQLIGDHWSFQVVDGQKEPWGAFPETEMLGHKIICYAVQQLIDHVDAGNEVGRGQIRNMLSVVIAGHLGGIAETINEGITDGEFTPTLLDKIAGA